MSEAFQFLLQKESKFQEIVNQYGFPIVPFREPGFPTLVILILEQQVSIASARAAYTKLELLTEISPKSLLNLSDEAFRNCGVSRQKAKYIRILSEAILSKELQVEKLPDLPHAEVRSELIKIKGIGNWTIDVYLMFSLQAEDIIPLGDIAVVNTIKELFGLTSKEEMEQLAENWIPYRSFATYLLWHHYLEKRGRKQSF